MHEKALIKFHETVKEDCDLIIAGMGLHASYPVWLPPMYDFLNTRIYYEMKLPEGTDGLSIKRKGFAPGFTDVPSAGIAVFAKGLSHCQLRTTMFHELGHLLYHQSELPHTCVRGGRNNRHELEADLIGAYFGAPGQAVLELFTQGYTAPQVAGILEVSDELLALRCEMMSVNNEFGIRENPLLIKGWF